VSKRLVVIGGVAGGATAAARAKRTNPEWDVIIFEKGPFVSYGACGIPYYIAGEIAKKEDLIIRWPHQFEQQGIRVHLYSEVKHIEPQRAEVEVFHAIDKKIAKYNYDALVIATGAIPIVPAVPGTELKGIFTLLYMMLKLFGMSLNLEKSKMPLWLEEVQSE